MKRTTTALLVLLALMGSACGSGEPEVHPSPTPTHSVPNLPPPRTTPPCERLAGPADEDPDTISRLGAVDYDGEAWRDASGQIIGYSLHEDSSVWDRADCVLIFPPYA